MSVLLIIFIVAAAVQLFYYLYFFRKLATYKETNSKPNYIPPRVSVIICAHNEEKNIEKYLHYVLRQVYSNEFEVLLVDDSSTDNSKEVVQELQNKYPHLKYIKNNKTQPGKKQALQFGIENSKYNHLLLIDADCYPASNTWMDKMMSKYSDPNIQIVLGYGAYFFEKQSFLSLIIQYETAMTAIQYLSFAIRGKAYMGVGRNLSYKKEIYDAQYFEKHAHLASGDDDLFIHATALKNNVAICTDKKAFTLSVSPSNWKSWFRQKVRHYTTGFEYKLETKLLLGLFLLSKALFYILLLPIFLLYQQNLPIVIIVFILLISLKKVITLPIYKKLNVSKMLINISIFIDVFWILSVLAMSFVSFFKNKKSWK